MKDKLVIAVTGSPGTGKTKFSRALSKKLGATLIDLNAFVREKGIYRLTKDGEMDVDLNKMRSEIAKLVKESSAPIVIDGLQSDLLPTKFLTHIVVLRTRPRVLQRRLRARGYPDKKIQDNVEAEALSIILWEAVQRHGLDKVYEIDTTGISTSRAIKLFLNALSGKISLKPGKIDWLEEFFMKR
jgi:adenylate kinase